MTFHDLVESSLGNLWRMKLRAGLTIAGVMVAIGTFVAMLSFGAGNQQYFTEQFHQLGLFSTMYVYPPDEDELPDTASAPVLDDDAIAELGALPGVEYAYPLDAFNVTVTSGDSSVGYRGRALSARAANSRMFSELEAGRPYQADSVAQTLVPANLLDRLGIESADSVLGKPLIIEIELSTIDSGLAYIIRDPEGRLEERLRSINFDSLGHPEYIRRVVRREAAGAAQRFFKGFMSAPIIVTDTLEMVGVLRTGNGARTVRSIMIPSRRAMAMLSQGLVAEPTELLSAIQSGRLSSVAEGDVARDYSRATLNLDPAVPYKQVKDTVEALGWRVFSYAEQFAEMQQFFFYFDLALGMIGLVALITAALGIANTMIMSILERRREIGVLKSLGADGRDIRIMFLAESAVVGAIGAVAGIVLGWVVSRISSSVARAIMEHNEVDPVDLFALPWWLILIAFGFGVTISVLAGMYPAGRAARVDPVETLRAE